MTKVKNLDQHNSIDFTLAGGETVSIAAGQSGNVDLPPTHPKIVGELIAGRIELSPSVAEKAFAADDKKGR